MEKKTKASLTLTGRKQAKLDHIAARGHAARKIPPKKRSAQQKRDIAIFISALGRKNRK